MTAEFPAAVAATPALEDCSADELHEYVQQAAGRRSSNCLTDLAASHFGPPQVGPRRGSDFSFHEAATSRTGEVGGRRRRLDARFIVDPCGLKEEVMQSVKYEPLSSRAKVAGAVFALVLSLASLSFVVVSFASASGELDLVVAKVNSEPAASAVAAKQRPAKPTPG